MKLLLRYVSIIAAVLLISYSCELDTNGPMPNDIAETCFPYIDIDEDVTSPFINIAEPESYVCAGTIDAIFDENVPFDKLKLVVAMNGQYDKAGVITDDITSVPHDFSISTSDIVGALDQLSSAADITLEDLFKVYVIPTFDGVEYPPYQVLNGKSYNTVSASILQNLTAFTGLSSADATISTMLVCALENGVDDLVGPWGGADIWFWESQVITEKASETSLSVYGMSFGLMQEWWGETIIEGGTFEMTVTDFGTVEIPRQYIYTTEYDGAPYRYEIAGSGFWNNCGETPTLSIQYDIYYEGDAAGLGASYGPAYLAGYPYLYAELSLIQ
jgi:hypothetical protein